MDFVQASDCAKGIAKFAESRDAVAAPRSDVGREDLVVGDLEVHVAAVALCQRKFAAPERPGVRNGPSAKRALDGQAQVLGLEIVCRALDEVEPQVVNDVQGLAKCIGDGAIKLGLGQEKLRS